MVTYYYAITDENDVLCVDKLGDPGDTFTEEQTAALAVHYPDTIYFGVSR